jgi:glycosyltransferase involved in cell wall biosynthesis
MKVLILHDYPNAIGGVEERIRNFRTHLRERGHDARLFSTSAIAGAAPSFADYQCFGTMGRFRGLLQTANPMAYMTLKQVLREFRPDVVHANIFLTQMSPLIMPLLRNIPSIYNACWFRAICPTGLKQLPDGRQCLSKPGSNCLQCLPVQDWAPLMVQMKMLKEWMHVFDAVVANSTYTANELTEYGIPRVRVIQNGVRATAQRTARSNTPLLSFSGRLMKYKGVDVLIRAFAQILETVPNCRLVIAGDGKERDNLLALAQDLHVSEKIEFLGYVSPEEQERALGPAWVHVIPSVWQEPFGLIAPEAMMRGVPIVATAVGALPQILEHERTGLLCEPRDPQALAQNILRLLQNHEQAEALVAAARPEALNLYTIDGFTDRFIALYQELLDANRGETQARDKLLAR